MQKGTRKEGTMGTFSFALIPALTLIYSVSLDSGSHMRMDEEGPKPWRTLSSCGLL